MNTQEYLETIDNKFTEIENMSGTREDCVEAWLAELYIDFKEFRNKTIEAMNSQRDVILTLKKQVVIVSVMSIFTLLITIL